mmetsp:Transcript_43353/g.85901  ORF Transcript_43353/g.85901 Transcript_43353/m.85901 type:complete len:200 (+) Transcript_43353:50-649(+)
MVNLRTAELEWNPDTDLLMSKLHQIEKDRAADSSIQSTLEKLASILKLPCCCMESVFVEPSINPHMSETTQLDYLTSKAESQTHPRNVGAANALAHDDEDDLPTVTVSSAPLAKDDVTMADQKPKLLPPPTVFTHDQTPCNSPRSLRRKKREWDDKFAIQEENGSDFEETDSQLGANNSKAKPRARLRWHNPLKHRART